MKQGFCEGSSKHVTGCSYSQAIQNPVGCSWTKHSWKLWIFLLKEKKIYQRHSKPGYYYVTLFKHPLSTGDGKKKRRKKPLTHLVINLILVSHLVALKCTIIFSNQNKTFWQNVCQRRTSVNVTMVCLSVLFYQKYVQFNGTWALPLQCESDPLLSEHLIRLISLTKALPVLLKDRWAKTRP